MESKNALVDQFTDIVLDYFPTITDEQIHQLITLESLVLAWNEKINLISRKDIEEVFIKHILHSLSIGIFNPFVPDSKIMDLGTGGGFPGLPLAILYPEVRFLLIDARNKKLKAVSDMAKQLGLQNVEVRHIRVEEMNGRYDFVVTRAVATIDKLWKWSAKLIDHKTHKNPLPNGLIALKGGDLTAEMSTLSKKSFYEMIDIAEYFEHLFFETKKIVYVQR